MQNGTCSTWRKDVYYRLLAKQNFNWRSLLFIFVKRYLELESKFTPSNNSPRCLIFDDTDIPKRGKTIEGISKIFNHVSHNFIFGYKLLLAGYWNGTLFIPVDFSFHRESKKKKYGLNAKQRKAQKRTSRDNGSAAIKRYNELNSKKSDILIQMYKRVKKRSIPVDYILIDSWFTTISLIRKIKNISSKTDIIGMYKYNSKIKCEGDSEKSIKQLRKEKKGLKRSRKTGFYYSSYIGEIDGIKVKVFLSRRGKRGAWHTIVSTNTKLSFNQMVEIYNIRWSIEIFFKEAKQLLRLGVHSQLTLMFKWRKQPLL